MKIAAAIKFSGQYCLCAIIYPVRTEPLVLLMLPWSCTEGTLRVSKGVWQVSPTTLYRLHVKPMSRHLLPPSFSPSLHSAAPTTVCIVPHSLPFFFFAHSTHNFWYIYLWISVISQISSYFSSWNYFKTTCDWISHKYVCVHPFLFYKYSNVTGDVQYLRPRWWRIPPHLVWIIEGFTFFFFFFFYWVLIFLSFAFLLLFGSPSAVFPLLK